MGAPLGLHPSDISARALRAGGAMALFRAKVDPSEIKLMGHWKSDAMLIYLHRSALNTLDFASRMLQMNNLNVCFEGLEAIDLICSLKEDIMVSSGSACASSKANPSHVLKAIGVSDADVYSNIRMSVGRFSTEEEIDFAIQKLSEAVLKLRR